MDALPAFAQNPCQILPSERYAWRGNDEQLLVYNTHSGLVALSSRILLRWIIAVKQTKAVSLAKSDLRPVWLPVPDVYRTFFASMSEEIADIIAAIQDLMAA